MTFFQRLEQWGKGSLFPYGLLDTLIVALLILFSAMLLSRYITRLLRKRNPQNLPFLLRIKRIAVILLTLYAILNLFIPARAILTPLLASGGIVAVVLGLAAQETVGNFISGLIIITFKPFRIHDLIRVDNGAYTGTVVEITLRHTIIETFENTRIIIPNAMINTAVLENISDINSAKADFLYLCVPYDSDLDTAMRIITEEVCAHPQYLDPRSEAEIEAGEPPLIIRATGFSENGIELRATVYSKDNSTCFIMLSDLRIAIKKRFDQEGIAFPYPRREVHIHKNA